jgi:pimeloyl-ACP methyl ester carboxylesterase
LVMIPRAGHFPMFESAGATRWYVREFLDRSVP